MGRSLTSRGLVGQVDRAVLDLVAPVVLDPVGQVDRAVLDPGGLADQVDLGLADPVDLGLAGPHPEDPAVLAHIRDPAGLDRAARVDLDPADLAVLDPAVPADIRDRAGRVDPDLAGRVGLAVPADIRDLVDRAGLDLAGRADLVDQGMNRVDPADRVDLAVPADLLDLVDRATRADRHRRLTRPEVLSTAVAPRWAARGTCRTASAHPVTVRRRRHQNTDGVGMADLHPERHRLSGTDRRRRVAGTVHRLRVAGMSPGMGRRATSALRSVILDRSITTGTARFRCSTRCSGDGASGSSESGFRCTDTSQTSRPSDLTYAGPKAVRCLFGQRLGPHMPAPERDASSVIPVQDVRRGYVPRQGARRHQSHWTAVGGGARSVHLPT